MDDRGRESGRPRGSSSGAPRPIPGLEAPVLLLLALFLPGSPLPAQELKLEWAGSQAGFSSYKPHHIALAPVRPQGIRALPPGLTRPLFGQVLVGPRETRLAYTLLIDEPEGRDQRFWVDANGNGDLTDDPPVSWVPGVSQAGKSTYRAAATLRVGYGGPPLALELAVYRLGTAIRGDTSPSLFCYRQWGYRGEAVLGGRSFRAMLDDELSTGDFRGSESERESGVALLLDLNGDGRFDSRGERFDVLKPFNVGGTSWEGTGLTASGAGARIVRSGRSVAETKPAVVLTVGGAPVPFEAKTTAGETIRFPGDGRGKVVLLDFWATWCGPCRSELPNLKSVYDSFHSRGFEVIGVSLDKVNPLERLATFTRENEIPWPQICDGKEWEGDLARAYNVQGIPQGFLVDRRTGRILAMGGGVRGAALRSAVEKALGGGGGSDSASSNTIAWSRRTPPAGAAPALPQAPLRSLTTEPVRGPAPADPLLGKAEAAVRSGRLLTSAQFLSLRRAPVPRPVPLLAPSTRELPGRAVARIARDGYLRAGWYYRCSKCGQWHLKLGGAYAVARDTVVTAWHVMTPPATSGSEYAVVVDGAENVVPVTGVVAASERMDTVVLRVDGGALVPLALSLAAEVGDAAFCFSDPLRQRGYFSAGIVNRFHQRGEESGYATAGPDPERTRMNVSTEWGPGSSGAAVLDSAGNVIGHVATIQPLFDQAAPAAPAEPDPEHRPQGPPLMTLHDAVPAKSVRGLLKN